LLETSAAPSARNVNGANEKGENDAHSIEIKIARRSEISIDQAR
jgi:hypothetical protein